MWAVVEGKGDSYTTAPFITLGQIHFGRLVTNDEHLDAVGAESNCRFVGVAVPMDVSDAAVPRVDKLHCGEITECSQASILAVACPSRSGAA